MKTFIIDKSFHDLSRKHKRMIRDAFRKLKSPETCRFYQCRVPMPKPIPMDPNGIKDPFQYITPSGYMVTFEVVKNEAGTLWKYKTFDT